MDYQYRAVQQGDGYAVARPLDIGNVFVGRVYRWMGVGLGITAAVALLVAHSPAIAAALLGTGLVWLVILAQLGLVIAITALSQRVSPAVVGALFVAYAASLGVTMASVLLFYTGASVVSTFAVTGGMFATTSLYGWTTKTDLTRFRTFFMMALIGLVLAMVVNFFVGSSALEWAISFIGVILFTALAAWDTQKIKQIGMQVDADSNQGKGLAIRGALALYLDFVNLFLFLLRFVGRRRN